MDQFDEGLRCQDVHAGLRNVDPNSGTLTLLARPQRQWVKRVSVAMRKSPCAAGSESPLVAS